MKQGGCKGGAGGVDAKSELSSPLAFFLGGIERREK